MRCVLLTLALCASIAAGGNTKNAQTQPQPQKYAMSLPDHLLESNCAPGLPYFSLRDATLVMSDANFAKMVKQHAHLLVIATHAHCLACCKHEAVIRDIELAANVPVARLEMATSPKFLAKYDQVKRFPFLIFFKDGHAYYYKDLLVAERVLRFRERVYAQGDMVAQVPSLAHLDDFLRAAPQGATSTTKVIGFFYDAEELDIEVQEFYDAAEKLRERLDIEFAIFAPRDKSEFKKVKKQYGNKFFDDYSLSSVVVVRGSANAKTSQFGFIDISDVIVKMQSLSAQIEKHALRVVDEFTMQNYAQYSEHDRPILVAVIDSVRDVDGSDAFLTVLERVALAYLDRVFVTWVEGNLNPEKKRMLGIAQDAPLPALAFFRIEMDLKVVFPEHVPLTQKNIDQFVNDYLEMPISAVLEKYSSIKDKIKQERVQRYVRHLDVAPGNKSIAQDSTLILRYNPSLVDVRVVRVFVHTALRVRALGFTKVKAYAQDVWDTTPFEIRIGSALKLREKDAEQVTPQNLLRAVAKHVLKVPDGAWDDDAWVPEDKAYRYYRQKLVAKGGEVNYEEYLLGDA